MIPDQFTIEEYQRVTRRQETHEARYYQMLALCVTGSAAVLGFSDKLPHNLIPYILSPLLLVTSRIASGNWMIHQFNAAFLLCGFENRYNSLKYEGAYTHLFLRKSSPTNIIQRIKWLVAQFTRDFALLNIMTLCASCYFAFPTLKMWVVAGQRFSALGYVIPFLGMHVLAAFLQYRATARSMLRFSIEVAKYLGDNCNSLETTSDSVPFAPSK